MTTTRYCPGCGFRLPIDLFYVKGRSVPYCQGCRRKLARPEKLVPLHRNIADKLRFVLDQIGRMRGKEI